jgi:hypothetical protein
MGQRLAAADAALREVTSVIERATRTTPWTGRDAETFVHAWNFVLRPQLRAAFEALGSAAAHLNEQADQQQRASAAGGGSTGWRMPEPLLRAQRFEGRGSGRADIVEAFHATSDTGRARPDEIEIRQLDNGNWIVVLPGVTDLSSTVDEVKKSSVIGAALGGGAGLLVGGALGAGDAMNSWYERSADEPNSVRRMAYAYEETRDDEDAFANPYAAKVIERMKAAGVPEGANVMLIGHSFGAYTAMELAGDPAFNSSESSERGFQVNVTHVLAAGADTSWKMTELPAHTESLVLNNRKDLVFVGEDPLQRDVSTTSNRNLNIEFYGGFEGYGHHPNNYANFLTEAHDRPELNQWLERAGELYSGAGTRGAARVEDIE